MSTSYTGGLQTYSKLSVSYRAVRYLSVSDVNSLIDTAKGVDAAVPLAHSQLRP